MVDFGCDGIVEEVVVRLVGGVSFDVLILSCVVFCFESCLFCIVWLEFWELVVCGGGGGNVWEGGGGGLGRWGSVVFLLLMGVMMVVVVCGGFDFMELCYVWFVSLFEFDFCGIGGFVWLLLNENWFKVYFLVILFSMCFFFLVLWFF